MKKVFVTGCFDPIHAGHVKFLELAATYGELYISIGSDATIESLKNRRPFITEGERKYHLESIKYAHNVMIGSGSGLIDFENELKQVMPDLFIVNKDGDHQTKQELCKRLGIEYKVLERIPHPGLPERSSTDIRSKMKMPYRIDLAGGWLDQPYVSKYHSGSVLTISIEPTHDFNLRSGMATSTRNKAIELWGNREPSVSEENAKALFGYENLPGTIDVSGSQDSIGIIYPGLNKLFYEKGEYWPRAITSINDDNVLNFLESLLYLLPMKPREGDFKVLSKTNINEESARLLADSTDLCFNSIISYDKTGFGKHMTDSFYNQVKMFPLMVNSDILEMIDSVKDSCYGYKISGAGGGGYLVLLSDKNIDNSLRVKIRRKRD